MQETALQISPYVVLFAAIKPMIVEWIKGSTLFPGITPETKERVLAVVMILSAGLGVLAAGLNGQIDDNLLNDLSVSIQNFVAVFGLSEVAYRHVYKRFFFN